MYKKPDICIICGKPTPPDGWSPWPAECDAGYQEMTYDGNRVPGYCDSKRLELPWPPKGLLGVTDD